MYVLYHEFMPKQSKAYDNDFPLIASPCMKKTKIHYYRVKMTLQYVICVWAGQRLDQR